jgi:hypothetical protein
LKGVDAQNCLKYYSIFTIRVLGSEAKSFQGKEKRLSHGHKCLMRLLFLIAQQQLSKEPFCICGTFTSKPKE